MAAPPDPLDLTSVRDIDRAAARLQERGYVLDHVGRVEVSDTVSRESWLDREDRLVVHLVDDYDLDTRYLEVIAGTDGEVTAVIRVLAAVIPTTSVSELLATGGDDRAQGLHRVALAAGPEPDPRVVATVVDGLADSSLDTRRRAVEAAGMLAWKEFEEPLADLAHRVLDDDFHDLVLRALALCSPVPHDWS